MQIIRNKFINFTDFVYKLFEMAELPLFFSKFSNQIYSNYQHLWMLVYRQFRKMTFQELIEELYANKEIRQYLALKKVPHYTTLIKFAQKLPTQIFEKLFDAFVKIVKPASRISIDATGMTLDNASSHYCKRIGLVDQKRHHLKLSFVVDIDQYLILACKARRNHRHDIVDAKPLLGKAFKRSNPEVVFADAGYDSQHMFDYILAESDAFPLIYQKNGHVPMHRRSGFNRRRCWEIFDYGQYGQRSKIETTNSIFKRRFRGTILARTFVTQKIRSIMQSYCLQH